jgi:DNA repair exonuclease SbcCD ATPase subunit
MLKIDRTRSEAASDTSIEFLKQTIVSVQMSLKDLRRVEKEIESDITSQPLTKEELQQDIEIRQQRINQINRYGSVLQKYKDSENDLARQQRRVDQAEQTAAKAKSQLESLQNILRRRLDGKQYDNFIESLKIMRDTQQDRENLLSQIETIRQKETGLIDPEEPSQERRDQLNKQIDDLQKETAELDQKLRSQKVLIDAMSRLKDNTHSEACPLCGSESQYWTVDLNQINNEFERNTDRKLEANQKLAVCNRELGEEQKIKQQYDKIITQRQTLLQQIRSLEKSLTEIPPVLLPLREIQAEINDLEKLVSDGRLAKNESQNTEQAFLREQEILKQTQQKFEQAETDFFEFDLESGKNLNDKEVREHIMDHAKAKIAENKERIQTLDAYFREQAETGGSIKEAERQLQEAERKLREQEALIAASGKTKQWFDSCDKAITWFKRDGLPRLIHRSILRQLSIIINTELEMYDKPFSIEVNDDLTFTATFADGVRINSRDLSGGQKVMFALSFLSAINSTFLKDIGIMIWDEPTDGLDAVNTDFLYAALERKKKLLHQRGQQLMIITFDTGMIPVFDTVYQLDNS